jgi:protein-serine/threonine kinase
MTSSTSFANAPSNVFKYIMRRSSSQAPSPPNFGAGAPVAFDEDAIDLGSPAHDLPTSGSGDGQQSRVEPIYGGKPDQHDEVLFSVEVTKLDRLDDLLSLDIRRLKGNLKSYKFLYDIIRE